MLYETIPVGPISGSPNGDNKETCSDFEPPIQIQSRIEKLPRWSRDNMNPSQLGKFSLKKILTLRPKCRWDSRQRRRLCAAAQDVMLNNSSWTDF